jgi:hypothetical protein
MSGVLDRMVQRARGELPAVEPLVPARQTALGSLAGFAVEEVEREVSSGSVPSRMEFLRRRRITKLDLSLEQHGVVSPASTSEPAIAGPHPVERLENAEREEQPLTEREEPHTEQTVTRGEKDIAQSNEAGRGAIDPGFAVSEGERIDPQPLRAQKGRRESAELQAGPAIERKMARQTVDLVDGQRQGVQRELRPPEPAVRAQASMIESGEHTEIHISVGSIEFHAPRTEAKAPPFRPRVTLDEFLRRARQERGHE